jgi:hypothetical protein
MYLAGMTSMMASIPAATAGPTASLLYRSIKMRASVAVTAHQSNTAPDAGKNVKRGLTIT